MTQDTLTEDLADWSAALSIDPQARLVLNVALTGQDSRNGYRYSESALREAVLLYDQKPVFLDHAPDRLKPRDRSTRDLVGNIINPRYEDGRIRGDIRVLDTESGRTFLALAHTNLPGVGMSHVVIAQRSPDSNTVEAIRDVVCVDAVVNPATTQTFRESQDPAASSEITHLEEQLQSSHQECQQLREQLAVLQSRVVLAERQCEAQKLIAESQLPAATITPLFLRQLEQAPTTEHRLELIRDRTKLCEQHRSRPPLSRERTSTTPPASLNSDLVAAIRYRT